MNKKLPQIEEGDYYIDSNGFFVFTDRYHLKRGWCCKSRCKHCPYGYNKEKK